MKCLIRFLSLALLTGLVLSCSTHSRQWPDSGVYRGTAIFGFEHSDFTPDGSREKWWLSGAVNEITDRMGADNLHNPVFLVLEGELSERGHHGHLGQYRRELRVMRVLEVK